MNTLLRLALLAGLAFASGFHADAAPFVHLAPLPNPKILASSDAVPGGSWRVARLIDGVARTEYASNGKGTETFVEFDFGAPVNVGAFRHVDRNDPATIAQSELVFLDAAGHTIQTVPVQHVCHRKGVTVFILPNPVKAQRLRWHVTRLANESANCVGGAELAFYAAGQSESIPESIAINAYSELLVEHGRTGLDQPLTVDVNYPYSASIDAVVRVEGQEPRRVHLAFPGQVLRYTTPVVQAKRTLWVSVDYNSRSIAMGEATLSPARHSTIYLLPHSHVDIGYTHLQADVERKQWQNMETALEICRKTASYPEGSRFKWNSEVLWAVDSYLRQAPPEKQHQLIHAIRTGQFGLDAMYGNELTGLCRPEELLRLMQWSATLGRRCGVTVDSAMISDVPGLTWGTITAFAQAGVKYFSLGNNFIDGGRTHLYWQDKPFYWVAPDRQTRILCWLPYKGYHLAHAEWKIDERLPERLRQMQSEGYPYDIVQLRWNIAGDNGPPDSTLSDVVRAWNEKYAYPKIIIATTSEMFRAFEKRHADRIPVVSGDFTPYWENGACSSARETAINRTAAERLVQAETLSAILAPKEFPADAFTEAWRNVLLYDEHTWGAHNSITEPDLPFVKQQWQVKQAFALDADRQSQKLLSAILDQRPESAATSAVDVWNTASWPRSGLVVLSRELSAAGDSVTDPHGNPQPSQRLCTGELAFLVPSRAPIPALSAARYRIGRGNSLQDGHAKASDGSLTTSTLSLAIDPATGAIASLRSASIPADLSDSKSGIGLNRYFYVLADHVKDPKPAGRPKITVQDAGPLVASLLVQSDAPGCAKLSRAIRVVDGLGEVDIVDLVDKLPIREKEAIHFGFAFNVPKGVMRMDIPWAVMRPELDQIPGSCKNWFSVGRWVDVSNSDYGVALATLDAPMVEVGAITADKLGSIPNPDAWLAKIEPSQTLYSMVMNNHWHTNYKADQEGPTTFRYRLLPHKSYDAVEVQRFGIASSQPLLAVPAKGPAPSARPFLQLDTPQVLVASLKPSEDGKARIVRLFNVGNQASKCNLDWGPAKPKAVSISNLAEQPVKAVLDSVMIPAHGVLTLRADLAD